MRSETDILEKFSRRVVTAYLDWRTNQAASLRGRATIKAESRFATLGTVASDVLGLVPTPWAFEMDVNDAMSAYVAANGTDPGALSSRRSDWWKGAAVAVAERLSGIATAAPDAPAPVPDTTFDGFLSRVVSDCVEGRS